MKKVLGLDLGTASIGWALVNQAESSGEHSSIIATGVRVNPLTTDEKDSFEKGKAITTNADRRQKRGMRRNLQRYKLRREHLLSVLRREGWINEDTVLSEQGARSTYQTFRFRAAAPAEEISLEDLSRVLLMINRKRGYKSNRKTDKGEEGHLIDGMEVARTLYDEGLTPGEYSLRLVDEGKRVLPDYYRSDLVAELEKIWLSQKVWYPDILTDEFKNSIENDGRNGVIKKFLSRYSIYTADNKGKDKKKTALEWRVKALTDQLDKETLAYVIVDLKGAIQGSSGYLGAISDRSKELVFDNFTVGQYLWRQIEQDPNYSTRNKVFYRQDYMDEFERIWECQKRFHPELNDELKSEIRDVVIFYQRRLKSQKNLISFCEFETRDITVEEAGVQKVRKCGCRVAPRSSLLFQEFKIWSVLNNISVKSRTDGSTVEVTDEMKRRLFDYLSVNDKITVSDMLRLFELKPKGYDVNYRDIQGNLTLAELYRKFFEVVSASGNGEHDLAKLSYSGAYKILFEVYSALGFSTEILSFDSSLPKEEYERQPLFKLWHLLYSYEGDNSKTGDESLIRRVAEICMMPEEYARIIASVKFLDDYASLSHKAMRKILPHLKDGYAYDEACARAGYNHSSSMTKEENEARVLKDRLEVLPKGALRNPVVEKILNQMVNVVNTLADEYGKPDEIHIEMARELKQNTKQREKATKDISENTKRDEEIVKKLQEEFGLKYVSKKDILRYRLYEELKPLGYKTLYSGQYIPKDRLFSNSIDIEHIIPQALMFDDSYSNKTLEFSDVNRDKGKETAFDYVSRKYGPAELDAYKLRVHELYSHEVISARKRDRLLMKQSDIPSDFVNRDLTNSQYIARKSTEMLGEFVRDVMPTTGSITALLREQWQLVDVMKELNLPKYRQAGKTFTVTKSDGQSLEKISDDWTKRNDHRHHAMDALTIAFTRRSHIKVLNTLNALPGSEDYSLKEMVTTVLPNRKRIFTPPMPLGELRSAFKEALESTLVSIKAKNKVATRNVNKSKIKDGTIAVETLTPRGQLHKEQVYGRRRVYETFEVTVGGKMDAAMIASVASRAEREALKRRLEAFGGDPKKAFTGKNSLEKNPLYVDELQSVAVPAKVKCVRMKEVYSIRKEIGPKLNIEQVLDGRIRNILESRLAEYDGNPDKAFVNLENNPIWIDKARGVKLRRVTTVSNGSLVAVRNKRDMNGCLVLDSCGNTIPNDYVDLQNNHHAAIFEDGSGNYQEHVVPFFEALERKIAGLPVIDKDFNKDLGWRFVFSMKSQEMFVFSNPKTGFDPADVDLTDPANYAAISPNLYRLQSVSPGYYIFWHHLETKTGKDNQIKELKDITWKRIRSLSDLKNVVKVRINHIGRIVAVGEY